MQGNEKEDSVRKKILILKRSKLSLLGAEKFLSKRGYEVFSTEDLRTAVFKAMKLKPDYIFVAFDHPNSKAAKLPKVFEQVLNAVTIPFVETQSSFALHSMKKTNPKYFVAPPVIGPKIERVLFKIQVDQQNEKDLNQEREKLHIEYSQKANTGEMIIKVRESTNDTLDVTSATLEKLGLDDYDEQSPQEHEGHFFVSETGSYRSEEDLSETFENEPQDNSESVHNSEMEQAGREGEPRLKNTERSYIDRQSVINERKAQEDSFFNEVYERASEVYLEVNSDKEEPDVTVDLLNQSLSELSIHAPPSLLPKELESPASYKKRMKNLLLAFVKKNKLRVKDLDENFKLHFSGALEASTFKTLQDLQVDPEKDQIIRILALSRKAQCFFIRGMGFKGYLIAASASEKILSDRSKLDFLGLIESKLKEYLSETNSDVKVFENMQIHFHEVDFKLFSLNKADFVHMVNSGFSLSKADFVHMVNSGEEQIAMAYFAANHPDLVTRDSKRKDMMAVSINEFAEEAPVDFDLYLHLPVNDKFIPYTKGGYTFYAGQRERLRRRGVGEMHVQNEDLPKLKKYRVQNYLNKIIMDFKMKKRTG
jgi:hypothetical protein